MKREKILVDFPRCPNFFISIDECKDSSQNSTISIYNKGDFLSAGDKVDEDKIKKHFEYTIKQKIISAEFIVDDTNPFCDWNSFRLVLEDNDGFFWSLCPVVPDVMIIEPKLKIFLSQSQFPFPHENGFVEKQGDSLFRKVGDFFCISNTNENVNLAKVTKQREELVSQSGLPSFGEIELKSELKNAIISSFDLKKDRSIPQIKALPSIIDVPSFRGGKGLPSDILINFREQMKKFFKQVNDTCDDLYVSESSRALITARMKILLERISKNYSTIKKHIEHQKIAKMEQITSLNENIIRFSRILSKLHSYHSTLSHETHKYVESVEIDEYQRMMQRVSAYKFVNPEIIGKLEFIRGRAGLASDRTEKLVNLIDEKEKAMISDKRKKKRNGIGSFHEIQSFGLFGSEYR
ncbi:hypothetical protein ADUPG1_012380 [Aduncisulcus paluster]|uniref:Uncharacterized protein n=1 Tax=Aduncisulcus paluster TaxID=2918883 RepID=A0ABQ5JZ96_9EUKA|nr:hypothetical protein ADUPG1_012380 [Aduncisulcus paluster]